MQIVSSLVQEAHCIKNKYRRGLNTMKRQRMFRKDLIKYFATSGLRSYSTVEKAQIHLFQVQENQ